MLVAHMNEHHCVSIRQGCRAVRLPRSSSGYTRGPRPDEEVIDALNTLMEQHPTIDFWPSVSRPRTRPPTRAWSKPPPTISTPD